MAARACASSDGPSSSPTRWPARGREAAAAFGDDTLLLERALLAARHVEVQVLADEHGGVVPLAERDCSTQRRHQKVVEEAPAPGLPTQVRQTLARSAVDACRAVGYVGAGTLEYLVDADGTVAFLEMNTRPAGRAPGDRGGARRRPRGGAARGRAGRPPARPRAPRRLATAGPPTRGRRRRRPAGVRLGAPRRGRGRPRLRGRGQALRRGPGRRLPAADGGRRDLAAGRRRGATAGVPRWRRRAPRSGSTAGSAAAPWWGRTTTRCSPRSWRSPSRASGRWTC